MPQVKEKTKVMNLEEVKEHFKNATHVKCLHDERIYKTNLEKMQVNHGDEIFEGDKLWVANWFFQEKLATLSLKSCFNNVAHSKERAKEVAIKVFTDKINAL